MLSLLNLSSSRKQLRKYSLLFCLTIRKTGKILFYSYLICALSHPNKMIVSLDLQILYFVIYLVCKYTFFTLHWYFTCMNEYYILIIVTKIWILNWIFFFVAMVNCCSFQEINSIVDNAFISCMTNVSCNASCCRSYIFSNGYIHQSYSCMNGGWKPELSSCKRMSVFLYHLRW